MTDVAGPSASASVASSPSASAVLVASAARPAPLVFGSDRAEMPFPLAGAALLVLLLVIAAWAWWQARRRGAGAGSARMGGMSNAGTRGVRRWLSPLTSIASLAPQGETPRLLATTRLDTHGRLHVIEWRGEQLLIAINGGTAPVLIARGAPRNSADLGARA